MHRNRSGTNASHLPHPLPLPRALVMTSSSFTRLLVAIRKSPLPAQCLPNWTCPHTHPSRQPTSSFDPCLASRNRHFVTSMSRSGCACRRRRHSLRGRILIPAQQCYFVLFRVDSGTNLCKPLRKLWEPIGRRPIFGVLLLALL